MKEIFRAIIMLLFSTSIVAGGAQLVYVKCCIPFERIQAIGECLTGPTWPPYSTRDCNLGANCIYGFGGDDPIALVELTSRMCSVDKSLPDQSNSFCALSHADDISIVELCKATDLGRGINIHPSFDYDGDDDFDLRDYWILQQELSCCP